MVGVGVKLRVTVAVWVGVVVRVGVDVTDGLGEALGEWVGLGDGLGGKVLVALGVTVGVGVANMESGCQSPVQSPNFTALKSSLMDSLPESSTSTEPATQLGWVLGSLTTAPDGSSPVIGTITQSLPQRSATGRRSMRPTEYCNSRLASIAVSVPLPLASQANLCSRVNDCKPIAASSVTTASRAVTPPRDSAGRTETIRCAPGAMSDTA
jgi:hypothetical protein